MMPTELPSRKSVPNPKAWPGRNKKLHVLFPRTKEGEDPTCNTKGELVYCPAQPGVAVFRASSPYPDALNLGEITGDEVAEAAKDMSDILANHGIEERVVIQKKGEPK